jgi:hypothetical protein
MRSSNPSGSFLLRLDAEQRAELDRLARETDLPLQQYLELRLLGRIAPRERARGRRGQRDQLPLPIPSNEGAPTRKSA